MYHPRFKTGRTGVPILRNADIDTDAELLLREYNPELLKTPQSLNVEDFAESYLGLNIHFEYLSNDGHIWGRMVFNNRQIPVFDPELGRAEYCPIDADTIVIDNRLLDEANESIFRSTMAHECGHDIYHVQIFWEDDSQPTLFSLDPPQEKIAATLCRAVDIEGSGTGDKPRPLTSDHDWIEHQAKYFSAAMLMPKSMVELICNEPALRKRLQDDACGFAEEFLAMHVADVFKVSLTSARIRIKQLKLGFANEPPRNPRGFYRAWPSSFFDGKL